VFTFSTTANTRTPRLATTLFPAASARPSELAPILFDIFSAESSAPDRF
jgi:hypothetical protein